MNSSGAANRNSSRDRQQLPQPIASDTCNLRRPQQQQQRRILLLLRLLHRSIRFRSDWIPGDDHRIRNIRVASSPDAVVAAVVGCAADAAAGDKTWQLLLLRQRPGLTSSCTRSTCSCSCCTYVLGIRSRGGGGVAAIQPTRTRSRSVNTCPSSWASLSSASVGIYNPDVPWGGSPSAASPRRWTASFPLPIAASTRRPTSWKFPNCAFSDSPVPFFVSGHVTRPWKRSSAAWRDHPAAYVCHFRLTIRSSWRNFEKSPPGDRCCCYCYCCCCDDESKNGVVVIQAKVANADLWCVLQQQTKPSWQRHSYLIDSLTPSFSALN